MSERKVEIEVFASDDGQHIVQVTISEGDKQIGQTRLPGGDIENATAMAKAFKRLADLGVDLTRILPDNAGTGAEMTT